MKPKIENVIGAILLSLLTIILMIVVSIIAIIIISICYYYLGEWFTIIFFLALALIILSRKMYKEIKKVNKDNHTINH